MHPYKQGTPSRAWAHCILAHQVLTAAIEDTTAAHSSATDSTWKPARTQEIQTSTKDHDPCPSWGAHRWQGHQHRGLPHTHTQPAPEPPPAWDSGSCFLPLQMQTVKPRPSRRAPYLHKRLQPWCHGPRRLLHCQPPALPLPLHLTAWHPACPHPRDSPQPQQWWTMTGRPHLQPWPQPTLPRRNGLICKQHLAASDLDLHCIPVTLFVQGGLTERDYTCIDYQTIILIKYLPFSKGNILGDFMYAFHIMTFSKGVYSKRKAFALKGSKMFPFREDLFSEGRQRLFWQLSPPENLSIPLKGNWYNFRGGTLSKLFSPFSRGANSFLFMLPV